MLPEHDAAAACGLTGLGAAGPVRIDVDVDVVHSLLSEAVHKSWCSDQVATYALESLPSVYAGLGHPTAHFFAAELHVQSVGGKIVAPGGSSSECSVPIAWELAAVLLHLVEGCLYARRRYRFATGQSTFGHEFLDLPRVALVLEVAVAPTYDAIEDATLFRIIRPRPKTGCDRDFVCLRDALLHPVQGVCGA